MHFSQSLKYKFSWGYSVISAYQEVTGKIYCLKQHFSLPATA